MKIDRLFSIVVILLNKNNVTAKELAEKFEVSTRTIYRDIDVLSSAGIPIYTNKGTGGGISLLENYTISKTMISEKESEGIILALKTLQTTKYPNIDTIISKLSSVFKNVGIEDWVKVDFSDWEGNTDSMDKFNTIKQAILGSQTIRFIYFNSYGERAVREVNPVNLIYKGRAWYLWAFCKLKNDFRIFKIDRIKELDILEENFEREELVKLKNYEYKESFNPYNKMVELELKFNCAVLYRLYDYFDDKDLVMNDDGSYLLNIAFPEDEWIYSFLQSFGGNVEVIKPQYIRNELINRLEKNLRIYNNR
ncbi:YafY family protein [Clostridium sediminicola]|uniref:helix-turn-helix transcriptional regulator n=1 Tax=Clostridium sediminicola TaxID=3114879 RepID=UPI0031F2121B